MFFNYSDSFTQITGILVEFQSPFQNSERIASQRTVRDEQPINTSLPIVITLSGTVILVREVQPSKARPPMVIISLGISISVRAVQFLNAFQPMETTVSGIIILSRDEQSLNAYPSMEITPSAIVTLSREVQPENPSTIVPLKIVTVFRLSFGIYVITFAGAVAFVMEVQPLKAFRAI